MSELTQAKLHHQSRAPSLSGLIYDLGPGYNWLIEDCGISASLRGLISSGGDAPDAPDGLLASLIAQILISIGDPQSLLKTWIGHQLTSLVAGSGDIDISRN